MPLSPHLQFPAGHSQFSYLYALFILFDTQPAHQFPHHLPLHPFLTPIDATYLFSGLLTSHSMWRKPLRSGIRLISSCASASWMCVGAPQLLPALPFSAWFHLSRAREQLAHRDRNTSDCSVHAPRFTDERAGWKRKPIISAASRVASAKVEPGSL